MKLTISERRQIADILAGIANEIARDLTDVEGRVGHDGHWKKPLVSDRSLVAMRREIARLRSLRDRVAPPAKEHREDRT